MLTVCYTDFCYILGSVLEIPLRNPVLYLSTWRYPKSFYANINQIRVTYKIHFHPLRCFIVIASSARTGKIITRIDTGGDIEIVMCRH